MAPEVVAEGVVLLRLQESIDRDMQAAQRKLERRLEDLDGKEANLRVNVRDKEALRDLDAIEKRVQKHQEALNAAEEAGDKRSAANAKSRLRRAQKAQAEWRNTHADLNRKLADLDKQRQRAVEDHEARLAAIQAKGAARREDIQRQHQAKLSREQEKAERERERALAKAERDRQRDLQRRLREERSMLRDHAAAMREDERRNYEAATATQRRALEEAKLNQELVKQIRNLNRLHRTRRPLRREHAAQYDIDVSAATAKVAALQAQIRAIGAEPVELRVNVNRTLASRLEDTTRRLVDFAGGFRNISVRVGPFTTSMGTLLKAMVVLGPVITSLTGSLVSLSAAMGAGLVGTITLAGGAMTGFGLSALGMFMAIKPVVGEINNAMKASEAYDKAVREHGKGSEQAATKLKVFNKVMKNQSAEAKRNYLAAGRMTEAWAKATEPARQTAFEVMGRGIRFASDNMDWFAQRTNTATKAVGDGLSSWMDRLSSAGGRSVLTNIFDNWNRSIGPLMAGLGNVAAYLGKVFSQASNHLPGIVQTFERWSDGLSRGFDGGAIDRLVDDARTLGRFLLAGGRALRTFFNTGREGGGNFLRDMTEGLDRWRAHMEGPGAATYRKFFDDARKNVEALWGALGPIFGQFIDWSVRMTPAITAILTGFAGVSTVLTGALNALTKIGSTLFGINDAGSTLIATFAAIWALGKVTAFAAGLLRVAAALKGIVTVLAVVRAAIAATFAMGSLRAGLGVMSAGLAASRVGMAGAGAAALGMSAPMLAAAAAVTGLGIAFYKNATDSDKWSKSAGETLTRLREQRKAWGDLSQTVDQNGDSMLSASRGVGDAERALREAQKEVKAAQAEVNALREAGKTKTDAYKEAVDRLNDAEQRRVDASADLYAAEQRRNEARKDLLAPIKEQGEQATKAIKDATKEMRGLENVEVGDALQRAVGAGGNFRDVLRDVHDISRETGRDWREVAEEFARGDGRVASNMRKYLGLQDEITAARKEQANVANQQILADLNIERAGRRFATISASAAKHFASIAAQAGKIGRRINVKIATTYENPQDAARVASRASAALRRGVSSKIVFDIVARDESARKTIDALDNRKPKDKKVEIKGDKSAFDRDIGNVDRRKPKPKSVPIGANASLFSRVWSFVGNLKQSLTVLIKGDHSPLQSLWNSLSGWAKTLWVNIAGRKQGYSGGVFFEGGSFARGGVQSQNSMVENAYRRAATSSAQRTRGGRYSKPTLLVGEEDRREYVIATNPAYRDSNTRYLAQAASEFGYSMVGRDGQVLAAARGHAPVLHNKPGRKIARRYKKYDGPQSDIWVNKTYARKHKVSSPRQKKPGRGSWLQDTTTGLYFSASDWMVGPGNRMIPQDAWRPPSPQGYGRDDWEAGAVPVDKQNDVIREFESLQRGITSRQGRIDKYKRRLRSSKYSKAQKKSYRRNIAEWERENSRDRKKRARLRGRYRLAGLNKGKTDQMRMYDDQASSAQERMSTAEQLGDHGGWATARNDREGALGNLKVLLENAVRAADDPVARSELQRQLDDTIGQLASLDNETFGGGIEGILNRQQQELLRRIQADVSLAEAGVAGMYQADWQGLLPGDDTPTAGEALVKFWEGVLDANRGADPGVIAQIANELASARGGGAGGGAPEGPTQGQLLNTERMSLLRDFASNAYSFGVGTAGAAGPSGGGMGVNPAMMADPYQGGDVTGAMTGGYVAAGMMRPAGQGSGTITSGAGGGATTKNVTVNNTFATVPPDPHTWSKGIEYELGTTD